MCEFKRLMENMLADMGSDLEEVRELHPAEVAAVDLRRAAADYSCALDCLVAHLRAHKCA